MALAPITLPRLQRGVPIVDNTGKPSGAFVRYWNVDFIGALERSINEVINVQSELAQAQADIEAAQADIEAAQAQIITNIAQIQALLGIAQSAAEAANDAQATADEALAAGTVSGSASNPAIDVPNSTWVLGPVVSLTGVVAGDLTIPGSGPIQDGDVTIDGAGIAATGEWRIVEIDGMTETTKFTGTFDASQPEGQATATITNNSAVAASAYVGALTTTGALDYRIDARCTLGGVSSLKLYIYARRAA